MLNMADEIDKRTTRSLIQKKSNETDILVLLKGVSAKLDQNQKELKNLDINVNNIFRVRGNNDVAPPVIVQFTTSLYKREFMLNYFKFGQLKLSDIGCNSDNRVYASDNLTKRNGDIHRTALQMLKDKKLFKVQTRSGFVFVQLSADCKLVKM
ncbi:hypothetical protein Bhyg_13435, partial [Pseudolycoriella hygida]